MGGFILASLENVQHDILIIIVAGLFILFASGLAIPLRFPEVPIVIP
jgi:hypothetical protein